MTQPHAESYLSTFTPKIDLLNKKSEDKAGMNSSISLPYIDVKSFYSISNTFYSLSTIVYNMSAVFPFWVIPLSSC